jgi:hypothetical protein
MTDYALPASGRSGRRRRHHHSPPLIRRLLVGLAVLAVIALAGAPIAYILWPQPRAVPPDAPSLPITIAGVTFNVPPASIRFKMQRRAGPQARIDLVFQWPSLEPPPPANAVTPADAPKVTERLFVTVAANDGVLAPIDRFKTIYPRYVVTGPVVNMNGLEVRAFRSGTPYQGEDLIYDPAAPERLLMRCTQPFGAMPGTCLHERRLGAADVTVRFPRDWLNDWRATADGIDRLIAKITPTGAER